MKWYKKEATWGFFIKFMICLNFVVLAFCFKVCNTRTRQDQETLEYINTLEQIVEQERKNRNILCDYIETLRSIEN